MTAPTPPSRRYQAGVAADRWQDDPAQRAALPELDRIHAALLAADTRKPAGLLSRWRRTEPDAVPGLYLWGKVGRGKTFLTDLLVESLPAEQLMRSHFHRFMRAVHEQLRELGDRRDPLPLIAQRMAGDVRLLCLDEFQVIDIGDAMLLGGLLEALFERGVTLVTTSNTRPDELYRDGLQRARFEPAIALLKRYCVVQEMVSPRDWRLRAQARTSHQPSTAPAQWHALSGSRSVAALNVASTTPARCSVAIAAHDAPLNRLATKPGEKCGLDHLPHWLVPAGPHADHKLSEAMQALAGSANTCGGVLEVNQRDIEVRQYGSDAAWFDFAALCDGPRAASDYLELAERFPALLISGVPQFNPDQESAARRFVHLVDALYDQHTLVLMSAMTPIVEMYDGDRLRAEFARTESRLIEMQGRDYNREGAVRA